MALSSENGKRAMREADKVWSQGDGVRLASDGKSAGKKVRKNPGMQLANRGKYMQNALVTLVNMLPLRFSCDLGAFFRRILFTTNCLGIFYVYPHSHQTRFSSRLLLLSRNEPCIRRVIFISSQTWSLKVERKSCSPTLSWRPTSTFYEDAYMNTSI